MGGKQSAISEEDLARVESSHPEFNHIRILTSSEGKTLQAEFSVGDAKDLDEWQKEYKSLQEHECLFLPIEHEVEKRFVCGQGGICKANYPHYQYLMSDYIARFTGQDTLYEQEKLWYLTYQLCAAAAIFHARGQKVGDLRPRNIFLNNLEKVKVGNRFSWPHETTNYSKAIFDKEVTYLAPEQIKELSFGHNQPETDFQKAESFSVGLTLLDRAVLSDSSDLYNLTNCRFDYQRLEERLAKLWQLGHFGQLFKQIVEGLCRPDPLQRLTCTQIHAWLSHYSNDILNKNQLHFAQIPSFLTPQQPPALVPVSHPVPIPKNLYVESQVVSEFTGRFAQPQPLHGFPVKQAESTFVPQAVSVGGPKMEPIEEDFAATLRKIQEQLQRSRRMFPS